MAGAGVLIDGRSGAHKRAKRRWALVWLPNWGMMFVLMIGLGLAVLALYLFSPDWIKLDRSLPVGMRSPLLADYSADPFAVAQPPLDDRIIVEALGDRAQPGGQGPAVQLATLAEPLRSPVPSITPGLYDTPAVVWTVAPSATRTLLATDTPAATQIATRTPRITFMATRIVTRTATRTPSRTPVIYHPSPTSGTIHTPTSAVPATPVVTVPSAATATQVATATQAAQPTRVPPTQEPPTPVPPPPTQQPYPPPPPVGTAYP